MGIMSKGSRLPERPKPPNWEAITADISGISSDSDVVFTIGKSSIATINSGITASTPPSESDHSQTTSDEIQASFASVVRLISLYAELKDAPSQLENQFSELKKMGDEMTETITKLKALAEDISLETSGAKGDAKSTDLTQQSSFSQSTTKPAADSNIASKEKSGRQKKKK